jgi:hypothetical protein
MRKPPRLTNLLKAFFKSLEKKVIVVQRVFVSTKTRVAEGKLRATKHARGKSK